MRAERQSCSYVVNDRDEIEQISESFCEFATDNGAGELAARVLGTSLYSHIHGDAVRSVYVQLLERVRSRKREVSFPFRCDSPSLRRYLTMHMVPLGDAMVELRSTVLCEEERAPVPLLNPTAEQGREMVLVCAWCKRVWASAWVEVEEAISLLGLFGQPEHPPLTHGICKQCEQRVFV